MKKKVRGVKICKWRGWRGFVLERFRAGTVDFGGSCFLLGIFDIFRGG